MLHVQPRLVIGGILDGLRSFRDLQWAETVHHHRELVRVFRSDARFGTARMRTMRNAVRMMRDASELDSFPAHELARRVVQDFVGVDIAVIVWSGDRFRMKIVRPRTERADDESVALECLVYRRRLMDAADDRLEVHDVECPWIEISIPADHIERMVVQHQLIDSVVLLYE